MFAKGFNHLTPTQNLEFFVLKNYSLVFTLNRPKSDAGSRNFEGRIFCISIIVACIIQTVYLVVQLCFADALYTALWIPFELCLGPLLCGFAYSNRKVQPATWVLLISLTVFLAVYLLLFSHQVFQNWMMSDNSRKSEWFLAVPISLAAYTSYAILSIKRGIISLSIKEELVLVLGILFLVMAALQGLVFYCKFILSIDLVVDYRVFFIVLLLAAALATVVYSFRITGTNEEQSEPLKYVKSSLSNHQAQKYQELVQDFLIKKKGFKRKDLSVQLLSTELGIPPHVFAQLFNVYFKKGFYQYVAEQRIEYAVKQLQTHPFKFTVEALAEDCGFNSKTSFNKYFKEQVGSTPKEFARIQVLRFEGI